MISTDFFQTLGETTSKLLPIGGLILVLVVVSYIRHRTRSGHSILRWIWSKLTGKAESKDAEFDKFMDGQDNLMQFRFVVGNARTLHQMHGIIRWAQTYDEDVSQAFACGPYFDLERPGLKPIHRGRTSLAALGVTLFASGLLLTTLALAAVAFSGGALVTINKSDTTLLLKKTSAQLIFETRRLDRQDCSNQPMASQKSGLTEADTRTICAEFAKGKSYEEYVAQAADETRFAFVLFFVLFTLPLSLVSYRFLSHVSAALAMDYRLNRQRP